MLDDIYIRIDGVNGTRSYLYKCIEPLNRLWTVDTGDIDYSDVPLVTLNQLALR